MNGTMNAGTHLPPAAPLFSVVIPLYNRASTISETIASVLAQSDPDFEIIVVDDGSTDQPGPVLAAIGDSRIRYVRQPNGGGGSARNRGIREAVGQYIAFLDSDDFFLPGKLETMRRHLDGDPMTVWYSYIQVDRGVGRSWIRPRRPIRQDEDVSEYLFVDNEIMQTSALVLPRSLANVVGFDPSLRKGQDLDFCLRLQRAGARFRMIDQPLTVWVDISEMGRTSRTPGYAAVLGWLDRCGHLLTPRALLGYRATVLAYYMAGEKPFLAARDLLMGLISAGVPPRVIARQVLRSYLPRQSYRNLVNAFVRRCGKSPIATGSNERRDSSPTSKPGTHAV